MKKILICFLIISIGCNVFFLQRKIKHIDREDEERKLHFYKKISHKEGYDYFLNQMKKNYPETNLSDKYFIVYMWDSTLYDNIHRNEMKTLDAMAANFGKYRLEYICATEMEEGASKSFLKRSDDIYSHLKMLYGMDDYISGLYSIKDIKLNKPKTINLNLSANKKEGQDEVVLNFKQKIFYLIMDSEGKVLHTNKNKFMISKDTAFLNKLNGLLPEKDLKILN